MLNFKLDKNDKNFKFMVLSAIILLVLFVFALIKGSILSKGYIAGILFLLVLLGLAFVASSKKEQIRAFLEAKLNIKVTDNPNIATQNGFEHMMAESTQLASSENMLFKSAIRFEDVLGIDAIKAELVEIVDFLNNPKKYKQFGVSLPKGVLLVGSPGVGKTMIAKALAGEAKVPFFYQSGASFVQIYVGMGAKRVRELFAKAKASAPAIIFIDEVDAVGKKRGDGRNDEREGTLNELLTQMDGFEESSGILVIAATNNIDVLDDALLRAGRFDRRIFVPMPNASDREKILNGYLRKKSLDFDVNVVAKDLVGFSGAAIATMVNEASLHQLRRNSMIMQLEDIEIAKNKIRFGTKENQFLSTQQKDILAIYQSAKAFFSWKLLVGFDKVSLLDDGVISYDKPYLSKSEMQNLIKIYLAGHVALEVIKFEQFGIFAQDIAHARKIAHKMASELLVDEDELKIFNTQKNEIKNAIVENKGAILRLKEIMLDKEEIRSSDLQGVLGSLL